MTIRLLVVDDHPVVRAGIVGLLAGEPEIEVVGEAGDGAQACDLAAELRVDGGAAANDLLMQRQSDLLGVPCVRPTIVETTALGSALLAGLAVGLWSTTEEVARSWHQDRRFEPSGAPAELEATRQRWKEAVSRA